MAMNPNIPSSSKIVRVAEQLRLLYARKEKVNRLIRALEVYAGRETTLVHRGKAAA